MSINLIKTEVKTNKIICQKYSQTMVESDIIVPDIKPDIKRVPDVSGYAYITERNIQSDKILLQGTVRFTVLYVPDGNVKGKIKSISAAREFTHTIDCRGLTPDMQLNAEVTSLSFDSTLINSRKLSVRCILGISSTVSNPAILPISTDAEEEADLALKKESLRLISETVPTQCRLVLRGQTELPAGKPAVNEILKTTASAYSVELCITDDRAIAKGNVKINMLYSAETENEDPEFMEFLIPFTENLDLNGLNEGMQCEIDYSLNDMYFEIREDADGEPRIIGTEIVLCASVKGSEAFDIEAITDAYSLYGDPDITYKTYNPEQLLDCSTAEVTLKDEAKTPQLMPAIKKIYEINSDASIDRISIENENVTVYGTIYTNILYLSDDIDMPISKFSHNTEFSHSFVVLGADNNTACDAKAFVESVSYTLNGENNPELRFVIGLNVKSISTDEITLIDEINIGKDENQLPPAYIAVYFVQKGDTLWDIAKHYRTTVENIKYLNHLEGDTIYPNQKIKITTGEAY